MAAVKHLAAEHLDLWATTIKRRRAAGCSSSNKIELYGIKKLRELILELAVRGLLVPQDPNDEPASELLKKIAVEKARLVKEGKIKKERRLSPVDNDERYFDVPSCWKWMHLQDVCEYIQRGKGPIYAESGQVRVVSQKCIQWKCFDISVSRFVDDASLSGYKEERFLKNKDILWNSTGTGTVGRANVLDEVPEKTLVADSHVTVVRTLIVNPKYFCFFILSPSVQARIEPTHAASLVSGSTQQVELNTSAVTTLSVPVPPLDEQHRIVAKVEELMTLCDQLEQQTDSSLSTHQNLLETLLNALTCADDHAQFTSNWQPIADHFDILFTTEESIDQLKKTILQLAVMGKLVPQDPIDEPASELLKRIAATKAKLSKAGKIKKEKPLPIIGDDEKPFDLPHGWEWVRLRTISVIGTGATPARENHSYYRPAEYSWVTSGETSQPFIAETRERISAKAVAETNVTIYPAGTLIVAMYGQGKTRGQITELLIPSGTNQACAAIQLIDSTPEHRSYIKVFFQNAYEDIRSRAEGGAQPNLNVGKISETVLPLPPLSEQRRIIAKVDKLISMCDLLKSNISEAKTIQIHMTDAISEKAFECHDKLSDRKIMPNRDTCC